jgi:hypothetical protein
MNLIHVSKVKVNPIHSITFYCASDESADALLAQLEKIGCKWGSAHEPTKWKPRINPPYVIEVHPDARITWRGPLDYNTLTRRVVL